MQLSRLPVRRLLVAAALLALASLAPRVERVRAEEPWRERAESVVRYDIQARLRSVAGEDDAMRIVGNEEIVWRNTSDEEVSVLYFHLYANAFRNTRSSFLREWSRDGWNRPEDLSWGGVEVQELALVSGERLALEYVSPDDGNAEDRTVARVALPRPVAPGESVGVRAKFTTRLPSVLARMGRHDDFVFAAQWYPKLGRFVGTDSTMANVREGWYCHQFHRASEFYADFADYSVRLTVPRDTVTGATGKLVSTDKRADRDVRVEQWEAEGVVDFAWTSDPGYEAHHRMIEPFQPRRGLAKKDDPVVAERRRIAELLGVEPSELTLPAVKVTVLLQPEHAKQLDRHFEAARVALGLYGLWLGPYPYEELTIVDPAHGARGAGGMEYPMLVTAGTRIGNPPESLRPEGVIVHEIGHQWFMNVLATNEAEEAWLDEGLNTYYTARALHTGYGRALQSNTVLGTPQLLAPFYEFPGLGAEWPAQFGLPDWAAPPPMEVFRAWRELPWLTWMETPRYLDDPLLPRRRSYLRRANWDELAKSSWDYVDRRSYGVNAYSRPSLFVATLRRLLHAEQGAVEGEKSFVLGMREYGRRFRFRHPTAADFLSTFGEVSGLDVAPLADQLITHSGVVDYAVEKLVPHDDPALEGLVTEDGALVPVPDPDETDPDEAGAGADDGTRKRTDLIVRRRGDAIVPVRIAVGRPVADSDPDGELSWEHITWDGRDRWRRFVLDGDVRAVRLHPHSEYLQDVDRNNDSRTRKANYRPGVKWGVRFLHWLENVALSYGRFL